MKRWEKLDEVVLPGGEEMTLVHRDGEYVIRVGWAELMSTRHHGSEDRLGEVGCAHLSAVESARVLIGGLGLGFTLAAALQVLRADAEVVVAELVPRVVEWNRGILRGVVGGGLEDARVTVRMEDVADQLRESSWDAVLLDVDNGPEGLTQQENDWLYGADGLGAIHRSLRPSGVLAVWSASMDGAFRRRMERAGFRVREEVVGAHGGRGRRHVIWVGEMGGS